MRRHIPPHSGNIEDIPVLPHCTSHFTSTWPLPTSRHFYLYLIHAKYGWNELADASYVFSFARRCLHQEHTT
ncbi:hypothetical protein HDV57DRAFT_494457 [Trichoderma longibrachiatum]